MLSTIRYLAIIFAILAQAVLGALGTGSLLSHLSYGVYLSVCACMAVSGVVSAIFMTLVALTELAQREASTAIALFEFIWVSLIWGVTIVQASYISAVDLDDCSAPYLVTPGWNICMAHQIAVPLTWVAALLATVHLVVLILLVEWHRSLSESVLPRKGAIVLTEPDKPLGRFQRFWIEVVYPELAALKPILFQSVYVLLKQQKSTTASASLDNREAGRTFIDRISHVLSSGRPDDEEHEKLASGEWTGSYYFQARPQIKSHSSIPIPTPAHVDVSRYAHMPRFQLRDEPSSLVVPSDPSVPTPKSKLVKPSIASTGNDLLRPTTQATLMTPSPSSSYFPHRSLTLPSPREPSRARVAGPPFEGPKLYRSQTLGARGYVPSRYKCLDLGIPMFDGAADSFKPPPLPPAGFLPRPSGRY